MPLLLKISIIVLSTIGFSISFYIYNKKKKKKKMICPRRSNCDTVIHSDYSRVLGIKVEILGMIYYAFMAAAYLSSFFVPLWSLQTGMIILGISMSSVLFSIYLVSIQAFIVRQWCIWCLSSAIISLLIFISSFLKFLIA